MMMTSTNRISQIRVYWDNMLSLSCSNSLELQDLSICEVESLYYEQCTFIGRRLRTQIILYIHIYKQIRFVYLGEYSLDRRFFITQILAYRTMVVQLSVKEKAVGSNPTMPVFLIRPGTLLRIYIFSTLQSSGWDGALSRLR